MEKIYIKPSPTADTRTADHEVSKDELRISTMLHKADVRKALLHFAANLRLAARDHDWTKLKYLDEFYDQFHKAQQTGDWGTGWYDQIHIVEERHHINGRCPEDVDLFDVLEMIADCVMAGMARSGKCTPVEIPAETLVRAFENTWRKLADAVEVRSDAE